MTDLTNNDAVVDMQAAALGITDSIYHDEEPGYLIKALTDLAIAKAIVLFDAADGGTSAI
jgi:hypothetical protein